MDDQQKVQQVTQAIQQAIQEGGVNPQVIVQFGNMAEQAIKDKALYPMFVKQLENYKLIDPGELGQSINYHALSMFVLMGKIAQKMARGVA